MATSGCSVRRFVSRETSSLSSSRDPPGLSSLCIPLSMPPASRTMALEDFSAISLIWSFSSSSVSISGDDLLEVLHHCTPLMARMRATFASSICLRRYVVADEDLAGDMA